MKKIFSGYCVVALFILVTLLTGCNAPSYSSRNNTYIPDKTESSYFEGEEITSETNVVKGGLGYSFDMHYNDLNLSEYAVPPEIKKFGELITNWNGKEFFPVIKLRFTPITGKLLNIHGIKPYPGVEKGSVKFPCYEDAQILKNTIKSKYSSLKEYTPALAKHIKELIGYGFAPRIEHKTIKYRHMGPSNYIYPRGIYIKIECHSDEKQSFLTITYENDDVRKILQEEYKTFIKNNEQKILDQKGIDPNKF